MPLLNYRFATANIGLNLGQALEDYWTRFGQEPRGIVVNQKQLAEAQAYTRKIRLPENVTISGSGGCFTCEVWLETNGDQTNGRGPDG